MRAVRTNMPQTDPGKRRVRRRLYAAWYFCIGVGFLLLGFRAYLLGATFWTVVLRWIIAVGFCLLAWLELRRKTA
jgi:hypothetical protein